MRRGFMGMILKLRCNRRSGWGKGLLQKKHAWVGQRSRWCWFVFWLERHCPSWICTTWSDGTRTVVPGSFSAFEGCCAQKEAWIVGKPDLDMAPAHASLLIRSFLAKYQTSVLPHPPYSPDLAPEDFLLFPKLKTTLQGRRFQTTEEIQENAIRELRAITESALQEAFQQWEKRWKRYIACRGD